MKTKYCFWSAACLMGFLFLARDIGAAGVVTVTNETNLRGALAGGGLVTFAVDGTIPLANPLVITNDTTFDGSSHNVIISGANTTQIMVVQPGVVLTLQNLTLANGLVVGGVAITNGLPGLGGAIYNNGGTVNALSCLFVGNKAQGGDSTAGNSAPNTGGTGFGGAVYLNGGVLAATNCNFISNQAFGGIGVSGMSPIGYGGAAQGGALGNQGGVVQLQGCIFASNSVVSGEGLRLTVSGYALGGPASGGAIFTSAGSVQAVSCVFSGNLATPVFAGQGFGGAVYQQGGTNIFLACLLTNNVAIGGASGLLFGNNHSSGGAALGGALYIASGNTFFTNSTLLGNSSVGGDGNSFSPPGPMGSGYGGAIYNNGSVGFGNSTLALNIAQGGSAGPIVIVPAVQGSGFGGGIYNNGGSVTAAFTTVAGNAAYQSAGGVAGSGIALGGGIFNTNGGTVSLQCTIVANSPSGNNAFGNITDAGHNLSSDASCNFTNLGSLNKTNPKLGVAAAHGGGLPTCALLPDSPAIDAGVAVAGVNADERGVARPYGVAPDIGAYEWNATSFYTAFDLSVIKGNGLYNNVSVVGPTGGVFRVQKSLDLSGWVDTATNTIPGQGFKTIADPSYSPA